MDPCMQRAVALAGAVIGAGFASGREIVSFFSAFGPYSWGLILLSSTAMLALCCLCMRCAHHSGCCWCDLYADHSSAIRRVSGFAVLLLQVLTGGSMLSAAGHIAALVLPFTGAYLWGVLGTLLIAMLMGECSFRPAAAISWLLGILYILAVLALLIFDGQDAPQVQQLQLPGRLGAGMVRAVAYAAMNLAISIGLICRCCDCSLRISYRAAALFALGMTALLFLGNALFLKHPEAAGKTFPMVALLSRFGKAGYVISLLMMYLAILTSLSAGLSALRTGFAMHFPGRRSAVPAALFPLLASSAGFEDLVDRWYAPAGVLCLLLVFLPLAISASER